MPTALAGLHEESGTVAQVKRVEGATATDAGAARAPSARAGRLRRDVPLALASLPLLLFLLVPLVALALRVAPADLLASVMSREVAQAIQLSMGTTLVALALTLAAGTPLAFFLARRSFPGRVVLEALLDLPLVLPPAVAGIALLVTFGRRGLLGTSLDAAGIDIAFTQIAVVMAQVFVAAPFYVRSARVAFGAVDRELEQAAAIDGAGPLAVFRHVTLPLSASALFGGAVMTWARALGEFGATILFAGNFPGRTQTMPLAIYLGFEQGDLSAALALAIVLLAVSFAVLLVVRGVLRQRVEPVS
jgi:molybdate transport system permease protein